jgi:prolyl-tRNA synthetase
MLMSHLAVHTLREAPSDADVLSHQLLVRAGFVRRLMAGVYTWLPVGWRTIRKIEAIIREEMDAAGAIEFRMPIIVPSEPWKVTGRWDNYGDEMFKLVDRNKRQLALGPTQEEVITPLMAGELRSYRDLPVNLYQIGWKYRDELRPRFGLVRGREFLMKDAYSFDRDKEGLDQSYQVMVDAYVRVFDRCSIDHRVIEADAGSIGGDVNHEFVAVADIGEDVFVECENGDYAADIEAAVPGQVTRSDPAEAGATREDLRDVHTPGRSSVAAVAELLGVDAGAVLKCMVYRAGDAPLAVLLPGDREVNEKALGSLVWPATLTPMGPEQLSALGLVPGFVGPHALPEGVRVIADHAISAASADKAWVIGANKEDHHLQGAYLGRDFEVGEWANVTLVRDGDRCPNDGGALRLRRSIVVGHTYQLGSRYSEPLDGTFVAEDGTTRHYQMGCYGIGLSRIVAAVVEQHHDDAGIVWPRSLAPFSVIVIPTKGGTEIDEARRIHDELCAAGVEALLDDRPGSAGAKFADADLIGFPVQVVVGPRGLERGIVDVKVRATGERNEVPLATATTEIMSVLAQLP